MPGIEACRRSLSDFTWNLSLRSKKLWGGKPEDLCENVVISNRITSNKVTVHGFRGSGFKSSRFRSRATKV
jgi:hypothetical protein